MQVELIKLISQGGMVSMSVAVILFAMSVGSWTLMAVKAIQLRWIRRNNASFLASLTPIGSQIDAFGQGFKDSSGELLFETESLRQAVSTIAGENLYGYSMQSISPYARLAWHGLNAEEQQDRFFRDRTGVADSLNDRLVQSLRRSIGHEALRLETGLTLLATIGSLSPFVGLFGTVWGIYHALAAISVGGQTTVDKVAGPVGEALIMTAFGLAVAIPAVLAYNGFIRDNRLLLAELENFAHDLHGSLTMTVPQPEKPTVRAVTGKQTMTVVS